ncbi:HU family DNA-binding protein [Primorskyibacter sp. S187A]|uniref:HU family DNA-binding protein n=1 Tax=Primorskyibacter sp. S187A TaxID=3415130 RepID=UPI003C7BBB71
MAPRKTKTTTSTSSKARKAPKTPAKSDTGQSPASEKAPAPRVKSKAAGPVRIAKVPAPEPKTHAPKAQGASTPTTPVVVADTPLHTTAAALRKQELMEKVVQRSGVKKRDAKPVIEAMLEVLGDALQEGRELKLEPFGKTKTTRVKQRAGVKVSVVKLRQRTEGPKNQNPPLAPAAE